MTSLGGSNQRAHHSGPGFLVAPSPPVMTEGRRG